MSRETDLAWAAGIIDGEGSICICRKYAGRTRYYLRVGVGNTSYFMLERLKEIFEFGSLKPWRLRTRIGKRVWIWIVHAKQAERLLRLIEPYIVAKREQVRLALEYRKHIINPRMNAPKKGNPNVEQIEWLRKRLSEVNHDPMSGIEIPVPLQVSQNQMELTIRGESNA